MRFTQVLLFPVLLFVVICAYAQEANPPSGLIQFSGDGRPEVMAWAVEGETEPFVSWLNDDNSEATVQAGMGCLVLLRSDYLPIVSLTEIKDGRDETLGDLEWKQGPRFFGSAVDSDGLPLPAAIRFKEETKPARDQNDLCREGLAALGFYETLASSSGHFQSSPLPMGKYVVRIEAPDHAMVERLLVISGDPLEYDLGTIKLKTIARVDVSVDTTDIGEDPPFELIVELERPTEIRQRDRWKRIFETEITPSAPVRLETEPGSHRLTLTKDGGNLAFATVEDFVPGWQETVLHPEPIFVEGTVTVEDQPAENAKIEFHGKGIEVKTISDQNGEYELTLWAPAHYAAIVTAPDGSAAFDPIDLKETEPGETVEHDFDLSAAKISGRVVASADQAPIEGCSVLLRHESDEQAKGSARSTTTSADGTFSFSGVWESESVWIAAIAEGYLPKDMDLAFGGESIRNIWIELDKSETIRGRVVGPSGEPVSGVEIVCCAMANVGGFSSRAISGQDGMFKLTALPGELLYANTPGYTLGWAVAGDGEDTVIGLEPLRAPTRVRIETEEGVPARGVHLVYVSDTGVALPPSLVFQHSIMNNLGAATDAEGVIHVGSLPPGVYRVLIGRESGLTTLGTLPIPSSGEVTLRVPDMKRIRDNQQKAEMTSGSGSGTGSVLNLPTGATEDES